MSDKDQQIEVLEAALAFRDSIVPQRDGDHYRQPLWHEWAVVEAFLAGVNFARAEANADAAIEQDRRNEFAAKVLDRMYHPSACEFSVDECEKHSRMRDQFDAIAAIAKARG